MDVNRKYMRIILITVNELKMLCIEGLVKTMERDKKERSRYRRATHLDGARYDIYISNEPWLGKALDARDE
jgi:hypothetical protein